MSKEFNAYEVINEAYFKDLLIVIIDAVDAPDKSMN